MTDTLVEIDVPSEFMDLCEGWAGGTDCMLRAIDSTTGLTLGTESHRPWNDDEERPMTDQEWHHSLYGSLSCDIAYNRRLAVKSGHEDAEALQRFEDWADEQAEFLAKEYGLEV